MLCGDNDATRRLQFAPTWRRFLSEGLGSTNGPSTSLRRACVPAISRSCRRRHLRLRRGASGGRLRRSIANGFFAFKPPAQGYPSIRGRQPSDSKFDLAVGELAPIFDNGRIATGRTFVDELAGLSPSLLQRQSEIFMCQVVILAFSQVAKIARPIRNTVRSSHCINLNVRGAE
jgi:hypothetical protein